MKIEKDNFLNIISSVYQKLTENIKGSYTKSVPNKARERQVRMRGTNNLESFAYETNFRKEFANSLNFGKKIKLLFFADDVNLCLGNPK